MDVSRSGAWLRSLFRSPRLAVAAILCFAVGMAAVSAMLTFARGVLLRPLPFPEADRLVRVWVAEDDAERERIPLSYPLLETLRGDVGTLEAFEGTARSRLLFLSRHGGRRVEGEAVTSGYFELLGIEPAAGRLFTRQEYEPGHEGVMLLGHAASGMLFGRSDAAVGGEVRTDQGVFEVVGVLPPGFTGTVEDDAGEIEFWLPIRHYVDAERRQRWDVGGIWGIGRRPPGTTASAVAAELATLEEHLAREHPDAHAGRSLAVEPFGRNWREGLWGGTKLLLGAALGLLLIAALNVSALLLARSLELRGDHAVRLALGEPPAAMVRSTLFEALGLAALGGLVGFGLGQLLLPWLLERATVELPDYVSARPDALSTLTAFTILAAAAVAAGVAPAATRARTDPAARLAEGGRGSSSTRVTRRLWSALVVAEVALTMALVFGSAVLLRSWHTLRTDDLGFRTEGVARLGFFAGQEDAPEVEDVLPLARRIRDELTTHPAVDDAALVWPTVPIWSPVEEAIRWPSMPDAMRERGLRVGMFAGDPGMFRLLELETVAGRTLESRDEGAEVAVVSRSLAERMGGPRRALGTELAIVGGAVRVVGVVEDARLGGADEDQAHRYEMYLPLTLTSQRSVTLLVSTERELPETLLSDLSRRIAELAPHSALDWVGSMDYWLGERYKDRRFAPLLLGVFATAALLITAIGVFALLAASVESRRREIAVRKALGATHRRVSGSILGRGVALTALGAILGAGICWGLARVLSAFVYEIGVRDTWSFLIAGGVLVVLGVGAAALPARTGSHVEPMHVLRDQ